MWCAFFSRQSRYSNATRALMNAKQSFWIMRVHQSPAFSIFFLYFSVRYAIVDGVCQALEHIPQFENDYWFVPPINLVNMFYFKCLFQEASFRTTTPINCQWSFHIPSVILKMTSAFKETLEISPIAGQPRTIPIPSSSANQTLL